MSNVVPFVPKVDPFTLKEHEAARLFPMMSGEDLSKLAEDIGKYGLRHAVTLARQTDGELVILDGRNRLMACRMTGEKPRYDILADGLDPVAYVVSTNLSRRHLDESQRAMVAARLATLRNGQNKPAQTCAASQAEAATKLNVGRRTVQSARVILNSGSDDLIHAVDNGEVSVRAAEPIARLPEEQRGEALSKAKEPDGRSAEHRRRLVEISRLHERGLSTKDIARETGFPQSSVSTLKKKLGVSANSTPVRLWADVEHAVTVLEGAELRIRQLADALDGAELSASEEEINACSKKLARITGAIRRLASAVRMHLP